MKLADIKPGMRAIVTGSNAGRPGGRLGRFYGKQFTVGNFLPCGEYQPEHWNPVFNGEAVWGSFRLLNIEGEGGNEDNRWVLHPSQFVVIADEKGNPVVDGVIKKGPLRGPDGRFLPKAAAKKAPVKVKKEEAPKLEPVDELEAALRKKLNGRELHVSTNAVLTDAGETILNPSDICAARWYPTRYKVKGDATHAIILIDQYHAGYDVKTKKEYEEFLDFMFNKSPWKNLFLTKSVEDAIKKHVSFNVEAKRSHVLNAQQVMRQFTEFPAFQETYRTLRKSFSVEHSVFLSCLFFRKNNDGEFTMRPNTGHTPFYNNGNVKQFKSSLVSGKFVDLEDEAYKVRTDYLGSISAAIAQEGAEGGGGFKDTLYKILGIKEAFGWDAKPIRPLTIADLGVAVGIVYG